MASKQPDGSGSEKFQAFIPGTTQSIVVAGTSAATSNAFAPGVSIVRVATDTACYIKFADSPTAASTDMYMPAGSVEYFGISAGGTTKLAAIQSTAGGLIRVTEGAVS